ncbi:MAG: hypothetical protein ACTSYO_07610 [Candidatus Ranarchaeia archaeon]
MTDLSKTQTKGLLKDITIHRPWWKFWYWGRRQLKSNILVVHPDAVNEIAALSEVDKESYSEKHNREKREFWDRFNDKHMSTGRLEGEIGQLGKTVKFNRSHRIKEHDVGEPGLNNALKEWAKQYKQAYKGSDGGWPRA